VRQTLQFPNSNGMRMLAGRSVANHEDTITIDVVKLCDRFARLSHCPGPLIERLGALRITVKTKNLEFPHPFADVPVVGGGSWGGSVSGAAAPAAATSARETTDTGSREGSCSSKSAICREWGGCALVRGGFSNSSRAVRQVTSWDEERLMHSERYS